ncbi:hypothetical protein C8R45DRAFT_927048 [Mycena sanguinolenta]|nr:hypothetical protein C8R45DRAFT_927048 [Mycena sanguinolenta]
MDDPRTLRMRGRGAACSNCRKKKTKVKNIFGRIQTNNLGLIHSFFQCIPMSDEGCGLCTRCALNGLKCEYSALAEEHHGAQSSTLPTERQIPPREYNYAPPRAAKSNSANMKEFLAATAPTSRSGARWPAPSVTSVPDSRYLYQSVQHLAAATPSPHAPRLGTHIPTASSLPAARQEYYPTDMSYLSGAGGSFYHQNYGASHVPHLPQKNASAHPWQKPIAVARRERAIAGPISTPPWPANPEIDSMQWPIMHHLGIVFHYAANTNTFGNGTVRHQLLLPNVVQWIPKHQMVLGPNHQNSSKSIG